MLLSPSRNGLQSMFDICVNYFEEHKITISTNIDLKKSKTKCIYFSHTKSNIDPASIMFNNVPLPWVDSWPHLGNELNQSDMIIKAGSSMDTDLESKRRKFIGKYHSLRQEFGFSSPDVFLKLINIYATSFYGSVLWDLTGTSAKKLFTSWNTLVRHTWNLPNICHKYFIEEISGSSHLKAILCQRFLTFAQSLLSSKKKCLSQLAKKMVMDQGSISGQNLNFVSIESGYSRQSILKMAPKAVINEMKCFPVPEDSAWKVNILKELIDIRDSVLHIGTKDDENFLTKKEIEDLIVLVSTK